MSSKITELYFKWKHSAFLFTLFCLVWFAWRVGTKPTRIGYPCQQVALSQIVLFFGPTMASLVGAYYKCVCYVRNHEFVKVAGTALAIAFLISGYWVYGNIRENQLRIQGSGTILKPSSVISSDLSGVGLATAVPPVGLLPVTYVDDPLVSVNYDPSITYGTTSPYDPEDNPVYDFIWDTAEKLGLGNSSNPLDDLINPGETVLIKPNWVDFGPAVFTRPQVVSPLIDMAIAAGATEIYVGDGAVNVPQTNDVMNNAGYSDMVSELDSQHPGITIETLNLNVLDSGWHWIYLGSHSSFAGSGYTHYDLAAGGSTLYGHSYYSTADPQGINPNGDTLGWYAVSDKILDADVIINVPKMKTHQTMMATLSIKNLVGCTISSTYDEEAYNTQSRIPHHTTDMEENYFNNDIFWRAIQDMNKIILYADENGDLQPAQQRKFLNVIDGIEAMEKSQHHIYGGGGTPYDRYIALASTDPVAADAVACRLMGYDATIIPSIENADSDTVHPIGTNDPENIVILGEEIDQKFCHIFEFNDAWEEYAGSLAITDFTPPVINSVTRQDNTVTADISGGLTAYLFYTVDGTEYYNQMNREDDSYSATIPDNAVEYWILAQDEHFNTVNSISGSCNLASYSDSEYNTPCDDFADYDTQHTIYMHGTNLIPNHNYRVVYYDGIDNKVATDDQRAGNSGNLSSQHTFKETAPADQPGAWHVIVCETTCSAPSTYNSSWPCIQVVDTLNVQQSAIPEFPKALAVIVILTLSACTYFWMRRHKAKSRTSQA